MPVPPSSRDTSAPAGRTPADRDPASGASTRGVLLAGGAIAALAVVYLGAVVGTGDSVPAGTTVAGVAIGGQSVAEAEATLERELGPRSRAAVVVTTNGARHQLAPAKAGLAFDPAATAASAAGREWNPLALLGRFVGDHEVAPVIVVDEPALTASLEALAKDVDVAPVAADVVVKGVTPSVVPPVDGSSLQVPEAATAVTDSYVRTRLAVELPMATVTPAVSLQEAERVRDEVAVKALSAPIEVKAATASASLSPADIGRALRFEVKDASLVPALDGKSLRNDLGDAFAKIEKPGRDATFRIVDDKPRVVPSVTGFGVAPTALAAAVGGVLTADGDARVATVTLGRIDPKLTTEQARALGVKQKVSEYVQEFPYAAYRVQNIGTAAKYIDGTLLLPGQTFSMNDTIKERTAENGYTKGFVIGEGGIFKLDEGGGVSTATTTMFNAAWFAGLELTEHRAHSIWIPDRYKPGREATVAWGSFDMRFTNNTPYGIFITTEMTDESMTATMWSTKVYDEVGSSFGEFRNEVPHGTVYSTDAECHAQNGVDGFTITVKRTLTKDGKVLPAEEYTTTYSPSPTVVCGPDPSLKPSPSASGSAKPGASGSPKPGSGSATPKPSASASKT